MKKVLIILLFIIFNSSFSLAKDNKKITVEEIENIFFERYYEKKKDNETWDDYFMRMQEVYASKLKAKKEKSKREKEEERKRLKQLRDQLDDQYDLAKKQDETWDDWQERTKEADKILLNATNKGIKKEEKRFREKRIEIRGIVKCLSPGFTDTNCNAKVVRVVFTRSEKYQKKRPGDIFFALKAIRGLTSDWDKYANRFDYYEGDKVVPGMRCSSFNFVKYGKHKGKNRARCVSFTRSTYKKIEKFKKDPSNEKVLGKKLIKYIKTQKMLNGIEDKIGTDNYFLLGDMLNAVVIDVEKNNISREFQKRRALLKKYSLILNDIKQKLNEDKYKSIDKDVSKLSKTYENLNSLTTNETVVNIDEAVDNIFDTNKLIQKSVLNSKDNEKEKLLALSSIYFMQTLIDSILSEIPEKYYVWTRELPIDLFSKSELIELENIVETMIKKNKEIKSAELTKSMDVINKYINTSDVIKTLNSLGMKNSISKEFTQNTATEIVKKQLSENLDKEILKDVKKIFKEMDKKELNDLTKEASKLASEVASDPSVKQSGSILDKKFGNITVKQLIGACRARGNC